MGLFQLAGLRMHTGGAHGWCSRVGRLHVTRAQESGALHAPLPTEPPWYHLGAAVANYVCASATAHASAKGVPRVRRANGSAHRRCRSQAWLNARDWRLGWRCPSRRRPSSWAYLQSAGPKTQAGASGTARERRRGGNQQNDGFPFSQGKRGTIEIPVTAE